MRIGERIKQLRKTLGLSQEEFARKIGKTKTAISYYESGKRKPEKTTLKLIEEVYNVNPQWLEKGKGEIFKKGFVTIPYFDLHLSAGYGIVNYEEAESIIKISEEFVRKKLGKLKTNGLVAFPIYGNSMFPTIPEDAIGIFIDYRKEGYLINGEIYALLIDDTYYIKRINKDPVNHAVTFISDNPEYKPFTLPKEELERVKILGRYIGHIKFK